MYLCTMFNSKEKCNMKLELKNIKIYEKLSEETTAFTADIFCNNTKIGYAKNDGHGGCTEYGSCPPHFEAMRAAELYAAEQPEIVYPNRYQGDRVFRIKSNMENWIDFTIAEHERKTFIKKLEKNMLKGVCFGSDCAYSIVTWKNYTLEQLLGTPVGKALIQKTVDELKAKGKQILNTNLVGINL